MIYTEEELKKCAGYADFVKGYEYFRYGYVKEIAIKTENNGLLIFSSKVAGSYGNFYKQTIQLSKTFGQITLYGNCSCPVGHNCKHIVAACLQQLHIPKKLDEKQQIQQWIHNVKQAIAPISQELPQESESFIIYRLFNDKSLYSPSDISFYKTKRGKGGKINKGNQISENNFLFNGNYDNILDEDDWIIGGLCKKLYSRRVGSIRISGVDGYRLLKKLVDSQRCFFDSSDTVLTLSSQKFDLSFQWVSQDLEHSMLMSNLNEHQVIVPTSPKMLLDEHNGLFYEMDTTLGSDVLTLLFKAPVSKNDHLVDIYEALHAIAPIPAPLGYSVQTLECMPVPHIRLGRQASHNSIHLSMRYGAYSVECAHKREHEYVTVSEGKLAIIRNAPHEEKCILELNAFGFDRAVVADKLYFLTDNNSQYSLGVWNDFLTLHIPHLQEAGWIVEFDDDFALSFASVESIEMESEEKNDWFSLSFDIKFGGVARPLVPLLASIIREFDHFDSLPAKLNLEIEENRYVTIDTAEMESVLKTIFELFDKADGDGKITLGAYESHLVGDLDEHIVWKGSKELLELSQKLKDFTTIQRVSPPASFQGALREYQQEGLDWLGFLHSFKFGGILADDMGLGKTIQTLCHLSRLKEIGALSAPSLIVMPTSLIANWRNEAVRFSPNLSVLILHGSQRSEFYNEIPLYDLVLTTYPLIARDIEQLENIQFEYVILDEAQRIKNPRTSMSQSIKMLKANHRLALSGTPIENHLGELWSIFGFLMPGFLGNQSFFREAYQNPIEKERDKATQERLNRRIKPFMLRRTKELVALELPPKTEIIKYTQFDTKQAKLYESIRVTMEKKVQDAIASKGLGKSHITILDALLKLRQVCCDPSLLSIVEGKKVKESAKLELLMDLLGELILEGRKVLIFSQFTSMLSIIETKLKEEEITYVKLTGETKKREEVIDEFSAGKVDVFLISLKAGGVGLNLVEADTVIHYDPWWNPAVENQATDRAYRIGQTKAVFVYKLIVENSIEQKILELQKKKYALQNTIYDGESEEGIQFKGDELIELLSC